MHRCFKAYLSANFQGSPWSPSILLSSLINWQEQASLSDIVSACQLALFIILPLPKFPFHSTDYFFPTFTGATPLPYSYNSSAVCPFQALVPALIFRPSKTGWTPDTQPPEWYQYYQPSKISITLATSAFQHSTPNNIIQLGGKQLFQTIILTSSPPSSKSIILGSASRILLPAAVTRRNPKTWSKLRVSGAGCLIVFNPKAISLIQTKSQISTYPALVLSLHFLKIPVTQWMLSSLLKSHFDKSAVFSV